METITNKELPRTEPPRITKQTTTDTMPLASPLRRAASPPAQIASREPYRGALQWAFAGRGWAAVCVGVDFAVLWVAVLLALGGISPALHAPAARVPVLMLPALAVLFLYLRGFYRERLRALALDGIAPLIGAVSVATMAAITLGLLVDGQAPSQRYAVRAWLFALLALGLGRTVLYLVRRWARAGRRVGKPVLIVGAGLVGARVARRLEARPEYGLIPVGFLDDEPRSVAEVGGREVPVLGTLEDLDETVRSTGVRQLIVAFSSVADGRLSGLVQRCQELGIGVWVVPRMFDTINQRASYVGYDAVGGLPLSPLTSVNPKGFQFAIKYGIDRLVAGMMLLVLSPLLALAALAVKLSTGGPVLFRQRRIGLDGHEFEMLKFRTMRGTPDQDGEADADWAMRIVRGDDDTAYGSLSTEPARSIDGAGAEDRRTPVGRLLRNLSVDELPQLWNVCIGDMSLVGPRPERVSYVRQFEPIVYRYRDRHRVKAGITGWAQVHGLRGQTSLAERVEWDNRYIASWSLGLDAKILVLTLAALFRDVR